MLPNCIFILQAVGKGAKFKDQVVTMAWYTPVTHTVVSSLDLSVGVVTSTEDAEEIAEPEEEEEERVRWFLKSQSATLRQMCQNFLLFSLFFERLWSATCGTCATIWGSLRKDTDNAIAIAI